MTVKTSAHHLAQQPEDVCSPGGMYACYWQKQHPGRNDLGASLLLARLCLSPWKAWFLLNPDALTGWVPRSETGTLLMVMCFPNGILPWLPMKPSDYPE